MIKKADAGPKPNPKPNPKSNPKSNRSILGITYAVAVLSLGLVAYLGYFLQVESGGVINNSYSVRLDSFSDHIVRDRILASDDAVLTQAQMDGGENETRVYLFGDIFDHVVGYPTKGKTGIKVLANLYLLISHVNLAEQTGNELTDNKNPGDDVYTTLDTELQQAAYAVLGAGGGVVIAMEPDIGKILAVVSKPGYGPNNLLGGWEALTAQDNKGGQLLNRAAQGLYSPGSTFKIVTALEYMRGYPADCKNYQFDCGGVYKSGGYRVRCYHSTVHRHQNFTLTFANPCNGVFASLSPTMDLGERNSTAGDLPFNGPFPLNGIPYKESACNMKPGAGIWEIPQTSIGRGTTQIIPLHNAMITATITNGGILMKPYFLDSAVNAGNETVRESVPTAYGSLTNVKEAAGLTELMKAAVTEGTGLAMRTDAYTVVAKTGSAEFETGKETHAWFIGFAPAESLRLVVTVLVEEGSSRGKTAAPITRQPSDICMSC